MKLSPLLGAPILIAACTSPTPSPIDCATFLSDQRQVMERLDTNHDHKIDKKEWEIEEKLIMDITNKINLEHNSISNSEEIRMVFLEFDINSDRTISFDELTRGYCK